MAQVIPLLWKDEDGDGLGGVLEIRAADIPAGACTKDLIEMVKHMIPQPSDTSNRRRVIFSIQLYGNKLPLLRSLEAILPTMKSAGPRMIVTCRVTSFLPGATFSAVRPDQSFRINIKMLTGKTVPIICDYWDTVWDVKHRIQQSQGIPPDQQRLIFALKQLEDDVQIVLYGMSEGSDVHLVLNLRGGYVPPGWFADVSDNSLLTSREFSSSAPRWRVCSKGLNVEGVCENRCCRAFGEMVIESQGFEAFNLHIDTMKCPVCSYLVKPLTCGFYDCTWKFEGVRTSDQCMVSSPWKDALGDIYHRFDADSSHGTVQWDSLLIIATHPHKKTTENPSTTEITTTYLTTPRTLEGEETCAICWSALRKASRESGATTTTHCQHHFHSKCIEEWANWCTRNQSLTTCPLCRSAIETTAHGA